MRKIICSIIFSIAMLFCLATTSYALTINEIYPAPSGGDSEWVELYNETNDTIDLSNYSVTDPTGKHITFESSTISGNGFVTATSKNVLNNTGDTVSLKDKDGNMIETVTYPGSLNEKKSYARCPDGKTGNWSVTETVTKGQSNASSCQNQAPNPPAPTSQPTASIPTPSIVTTAPQAAQTQPIYNNIYISEVMAYPKAGDHEWVELYNDNSYLITLSNWHIDDFENGGSSPKTFSLTIAAKNYGVIDLSTAMFNNDADTVRLLDENNVLKDSISYSQAVQDTTIGKVTLQNNAVCMQNPTKAGVNGDCIKKNTPAVVVTSKSTSVTAPTGGFTSPLKTAIIITQPVVAKKTTPKNTEIVLSQSDAIEHISPVTPIAGDVLGQTATLTDSPTTPYPTGLIKGLSGSSYLISLLAGTLSVKRMFKKFRSSYI